MTAANAIQLSALTTSLLASDPPEQLVYPILHPTNQIIVGVCAQNSLPPRIFLPPPLRLSSYPISYSALTEKTNSSSNIFTLHFKGTVSVPAPNTSSFCLVRPTDVILVNDTLLDSNVKAIVNSADGWSSVRLFPRPETIPDKPIAPCLSNLNNIHRFAHLDLLVYCEPDSSRKEIEALLNEAATRALNVMTSVDESLKLATRHYGVLGQGLCISVSSPELEEKRDEDEEELKIWRGRVHECLKLPKDRPLLRRARAKYQGDLPEEWDGGCRGRLMNVHLGMKGNHGMGKESIKVEMVKGDYLYCHYLQGGEKDSGWGCAYRSLQTLVSWVAKEGYSELKEGKLPSIGEIQTALVEMGDKPEKLIGSKDWIGANEVCYALEHLTGVSSKIVHVSRGGDMESKGRELAIHFEKVGSPVMVGGGVLAWTILGIARNERTGKCKFLILDPHYEGKDDLKIVQAKGWVGWKGVNVFRKNTFYNLCLPQRPQGV